MNIGFFSFLYLKTSIFTFIILYINIAALYILPRIFHSKTICSSTLNVSLKKRKIEKWRPSTEEIADGFVCFAKVIVF